MPACLSASLFSCLTGGVEEQEGFLCPVCMAACSSPESLHQHFEASHSEPASHQHAPEENYRLVGTGTRSVVQIILYVKHDIDCVIPG